VVGPALFAQGELEDLVHVLVGPERFSALGHSPILAGG
jgi:hypothetical protein